MSESLLSVVRMFWPVGKKNKDDNNADLEELVRLAVFGNKSKRKKGLATTIVMRRREAATEKKR